jgi:ABC-2 type transport system ATP-binding protein
MMTERAVISLEGVKKSYGGGFELGPINLRIEPGHIVAVVGPNGAGKSTLFGILMGLIHPDSGNVSLFGLDHPEDEVEIKRRIGYVPQRAIGHDDLSAKALGRFISHWYPHWNEELYRELLMRYAVDLRKRFDKLSTGDQRRLSFALALARGTELLLLDEPTAGVDPVGRKEMLGDVSRFVHQGAGARTAVFATQVMEEAKRVADYVAFLVDGELLGPFGKNALLGGWKTFWLEEEPDGDVLGLVEVQGGNPVRIVTDSPEETREALSSENIRIVWEGPVDLEEILSYLVHRSTERRIKSSRAGE